MTLKDKSLGKQRPMKDDSNGCLFMVAILILFFGFIFWITPKSKHRDVNTEYVRLVDQIIEADRTKTEYIFLETIYEGAILSVMNKVALKDGWEPISGVERVKGEGSWFMYMQTIKKKDKELALVRVDGKLILNRYKEP
jgi:nucleoside recognition membrane protein YjiH